MTEKVYKVATKSEATSFDRSNKMDLFLGHPIYRINTDKSMHGGYLLG